MSRRYKYRIEVYQNVEVDDGSGGTILSDTPTKLGDSWCDIKTIPQNKITDYGLDVEKEAIRIRLRYRSDIDYNSVGLFFRYKTKNWMPNSIERKDLEEYEVEIIAVSNG